MPAHEGTFPPPDSALSAAEQLVERLLQTADWVLDPSSQEAKSAAEEVKGFLKLFFDAEARGSAQATGLNSLHVEGLDREQIWEELEVRNVPLRRALRRHVVSLSDPQEPVDLGLSEPVIPAASSSASKASDKKSAGREAVKGKTGLKALGDAKDATKASKASASKGSKKKADKEEMEGEAPDGQDFFSLEEMNRFADLADEGKIRLDEDAGESDFELLEADDDDEEGKDMKFEDFFGPADQVKLQGAKAKRSKGKKEEDLMEELGEEEEEEGLGALDEDGEEGEEEPLGLAGDEELSDEEKELEEQILQLQAQGKKGKEAEEDDAEEEEEEAVAGDEEEGGGSKSTQTLYEMDKRLKSLEEEVSKLEEEQLQEKPWTMKGEVSAMQRPLNSLLEVHLDQPMTHFAARRAEDAALAAGAAVEGDEALEDLRGAEELAKQARFDVEAIIKQRVWDEAFDDVVRKAELPPSQRPQNTDEDPVETLNFEKSRVGLGDIYAQQYEAEIFGHKTATEKEEDKEKTEAKKIFLKLMYKLDLLSNAHFTPRPPMISVAGDQLSKVPALKMEETIPLMVSDAQLQAPEELRKPRRHEKEQEELSHGERVAARRAKKGKRRKALEQKVTAGQLTLSGMREREKKLATKNQQVKEAESKKGQVKDAKKRIRSTELLSQAAANSATQVSRKEAIRQEREQRPDGTPASKRLKL